MPPSPPGPASTPPPSCISPPAAPPCPSAAPIPPFPPPPIIPPPLPDWPASPFCAPASAAQKGGHALPRSPPQPAIQSDKAAVTPTTNVRIWDGLLSMRGSLLTSITQQGVCRTELRDKPALARV